MPTDHHLLSVYPTYGPCNMVVNLQSFVTERGNYVEVQRCKVCIAALRRYKSSRLKQLATALAKYLSKLLLKGGRAILDCCNRKYSYKLEKLHRFLRICNESMSDCMTLYILNTAQYISLTILRGGRTYKSVRMRLHCV